MFREERGASITRVEHPVEEGIFRRRVVRLDVTAYRFTDGAKRTPLVLQFSPDEFRVLVKEQMQNPVSLASEGSKRWWMYQDRFYVEDEDLNADDVGVLAAETQRKHERRLAHAHAMRDVGSGSVGTPRETIPADVRAEVFQRFQGRCGECGSRERLEFDHIVPLALGGSNTVRNLQLLCERCNRSKGARL